MRHLRQFLCDQRGSSAVEFAVAVPVLVAMIWGIFQLAVLFQANAGMQHSLGEAARYATVWLPETNAPPTDAQLQARITSTKFGVGNGTWDTPVITTDAATNSKTITVTFHQPMDFLFIGGPTVDLTATKVVYLAS